MSKSKSKPAEQTPAADTAEQSPGLALDPGRAEAAAEEANAAPAGAGDQAEAATPAEPEAVAATTAAKAAPEASPVRKSLERYLADASRAGVATMVLTLRPMDDPDDPHFAVMLRPEGRDGETLDYEIRGGTAICSSVFLHELEEENASRPDGQPSNGGDTLRPAYRALSREEAVTVAGLKDVGAGFLALLARSHDPRAAALARTKLEEAVMWAVKGVTAPPTQPPR